MLLSLSLFGAFAVAPPVKPAARPTPSIRDGAGLFSPEAIQRAQKRIDKVRDEHKIDLRIETVASLPGVTPQRLRGMGNEERKALLLSTAEAAADRPGFSGLFVLILAEPRHATVVGWPKGRESDVSSTKRRRLQRIFADRDGRDPDLPLRAGVDEYAGLMREVYGGAASPLPTPVAFAILGGLVGGWVLLRFARARLLAPAPPIYRPAMLGSLFGVPSAFWIYDRLFEAERPLDPPAPAAAAVSEEAPFDPGAGEGGGEL